MKKLEDYVLSIPDFPEPGIIFRDITTVIQDAEGLKLAIDTMSDFLKDKDFDVVVGPEARGFIFGMPIAYNFAKVLYQSEKRESFQEKRYLFPMNWNTAARGGAA